VTARPARLGLFGLLGSGNSGNDASMETVLSYFREAHPQVRIDAMSGGHPEVVKAKWDLDAVRLYWVTQFEDKPSRVPQPVLKAVGKGLDIARVANWVRKHDAVIVPGAGPLESTLPQNAWGFPFQLLVLSASGKLLGTKVAFVSVGAEIIKPKVTRWLSDNTARLAYYRSYRDQNSWDSMRDRGHDVSRDKIFPDLVFGVPTPPVQPGDPRVVGLGVMNYRGGNNDKDRADEIHADYLAKVTEFATWLVDNGYEIKIFGGDSKYDWDIARKIMADVRAERPELPEHAFTADEVHSYAELMELINGCGTIVATRYHNVMCALKLCKPTIGLGYSRKFVSLLGQMGLGDFNMYADRIEVDKLTDMFRQLDKRRDELTSAMKDRNAANAKSLSDQFSLLSRVLLPPRG
jgi:polysaccharide pyruvyl transferase WcaK-like protein